MVKIETRRDKWEKRWWIGTPNGGSILILNPSESDGMEDMDGNPLLDMDGNPIKPMT